MRLLRASLSFVLALPTASAVHAQEQQTPSRFTVEKRLDGSLKVVPAATLPKRSENMTAKTVDEAVAGFLAPSEVIAKLKSQEFWVTSGTDGAVKSVYVVPKGETPPDSMFAATAEGWTIAKVSGSSALKDYLPNSADMTAVLSELMTNAKTAVCEMPARPSEFGTVVDISAGIGVTGRIEFNATWETSELCK